jgi:hypothetical protein
MEKDCLKPYSEQLLSALAELEPNQKFEVAIALLPCQDSIVCLELRSDIEECLYNLFECQDDAGRPLSLQSVTQLYKALTKHTYQNPGLESAICAVLEQNTQSLSLQQLETTLWALKERMMFTQESPSLSSVIIPQAVQKSASMKPRGIAYTIESIALLNPSCQLSFSRLENVVLARIDEFNPFLLTKLLSSFPRDLGSPQLFAAVLQKLMPQVRGLAFSDILKLFQVLPNLKSMDARLYDILVEKVESRVEGCSAQDLMAISDFLVDNH